MDRTYRLIYLDLSDAVARVEDIHARDDQTAVNQAYEAHGRQAAELWDGLRQVARIPRESGLRHGV